MNKNINNKKLIIILTAAFVAGIILSLAIFKWIPAAIVKRETENLITTEEPTQEITVPIETQTDEPPAESTSTESPTTDEPSAVSATGVEVDPTTAKTMYTITNVNVRTGASLESPIVTTLYTGKEIQVCEVGNDEWAIVILDDTYYYINKNFIVETPPQTNPPETAAPTTVTQPANKNDEFHYYGIWTGEYWHFTPEQIDNQWNGYKTSKPALATGTTRAWQTYLYQKLSERGFGWWYKYACAQAMQESGFNPLADNGVDYGLFSFRLRYWNSSYGSVYDYHANINAYVDRISKYLVGVSTQTDIYMALSQHYLPDGQLHMNYVNAVLSRLNELWICD